MGILDDAIRQHLELKRRLGADDDELKQLEDEAFGPPARPGEPDFPEAEGDGGGDGEAGEAQAEADIAEAPDEPAAEPVAEDDHALEDEPSDEEPPVTEHAVLAPEAVEGDAEEAQEAGGLFDQSPDEELDLSDLDLDLDDEEDELPPPAAAAPAIETLETEEHTLEEFEEEDVEEEHVEEEDVEEEPIAEPESEPDDEDDGDDEDVLADTPEFLRDDARGRRALVRAGQAEGLRLRRVGRPPRGRGLSSWR